MIAPQIKEMIKRKKEKDNYKKYKRENEINQKKRQQNIKWDETKCYPCLNGLVQCGGTMYGFSSNNCLYNTQNTKYCNARILSNITLLKMLYGWVLRIEILFFIL
jgi:hypothetical protein